MYVYFYGRHSIFGSRSSPNTLDRLHERQIEKNVGFQTISMSN